MSGRVDAAPVRGAIAVRQGSARPHRRGSARFGRAGLIGLAAVLGIFLALPVTVLVIRSVAGGALIGVIGSAAVLDALGLSLMTTAASVALAVLFGTPLAIILARRRFRGSSLVEAAVDLPIVLPPSVAGLALLLVFGRRGLLGEPLQLVGLSIPFTVLAVVLAQTFVAAPFFIRSARAGIAAVDRDLEDAARVDGASERHVFRWITVPLAAPALAAGLVMCWARALGEFGATIMFAGNVAGRTQTLPLVVYGEFQGGGLDASIAAATILVLAALGVLIAVRALRWGRALDLRGSG
jgi:molybdate transport system permease protein